MKALSAVVLFVLAAGCCVAQQMWTEHPISSNQINWFADHADLNGDGWIDIYTPTEYRLVWLENVPGELDFVRHPILTQRRPSRYTHGDLDNDGDIDILAMENGLDTLRVFENSGDGSSWTEHEIPISSFGSASKIVLADVDNDGFLDILYSRALNEFGVIWLDYDGDLYSMASNEIQSHFQFHSTSEMLCADMDLDGDQDIIISYDHRYSAWLRWIENDDNGQTWTRHEIVENAGATSIAPYDFNGDGTLDLACGSIDDGLNVLYAVEPGGPWNIVVIDPNQEYNDLAIADFDQDGDMDFVGQRRLSCVWWENRPIRGWRHHLVYGGDSPYDPHELLCADFGSDGWPDLVFTNYHRIFQNNLMNVEYAVTTMPFHEEPRYIYPSGRNLGLYWTVWNRTTSDASFDVWGEAVYEDGTVYLQHMFFSDILIQAGWQRGESRWMFIPGTGPVGDYHLVTKLGTFPNTVVASDTIRAYRGTQSDPDIFDSAIGTEPDDANRIVCTPNPFNTMGTVTLTLPEAEQVRVTVHNMLGQTVATLADGTFNAGTQEFVLDGSSWASGVYFVRADVAGQAPLMQKVVLVK